MNKLIICRECKEEKDEELFTFHDKRINKRSFLCKICQSVYSKKYREKNREVINVGQILYREKNKEKVLLRKAIQRSVKKGFECNITIEDIEIPDFCPVLGIPLFIGRVKQQHNSPSIDRIDNSKGYVKGNIRVISWRANDLKRNATLEEMKKIVLDMEINNKEGCKNDER